MSPAPFLVRAMKPEERGRVEAMSALAFSTVREVYRPNWEAVRRRGRTRGIRRTLVALDAERIVGSAEYRRERDALLVTGLGVIPAARQRGAARALLAAVEAEARRWGRTRIRLWTVKETGNVPIFLKLGFHAADEQPSLLFESDRHPRLTEVLLVREVAQAPPSGTDGARA